MVVKVDDFGAVEAVTATYVLPFPAPDALRPFEGDAKTIDGGLLAKRWGVEVRELTALRKRLEEIAA